MTGRLRKEIDRLKRDLLSLVTTVEEDLHRAVQSLILRDAAMARTVIEDEYGIDEKEVQLEEECLKILALYQPVANDLRFIIAILKINNDLERINDLSVNIADRVRYILQYPQESIRFDFELMGTRVQKMLRDSIDAFVNLDQRMAKDVCGSDNTIDDMNREMFEIVEKRVQADPSSVSILLNYLSVSRHLERIADLATNIAEDVIYFIEGEIVRHRVETYQPRDR